MKFFLKRGVVSLWRVPSWVCLRVLLSVRASLVERSKEQLPLHCFAAKELRKWAPFVIRESFRKRERDSTWKQSQMSERMALVSNGQKCFTNREWKGRRRRIQTLLCEASIWQNEYEENMKHKQTQTHTVRRRRRRRRRSKRSLRFT